MNIAKLFLLSSLLLSLFLGCESKSSRESVNSSSSNAAPPADDSDDTTGSSDGGTTVADDGGNTANPVNGGWGQWSSWSSCNAECKKSHWRLCNNPLPKNGGLNCSGPSEEFVSCSASECQIVDANPTSCPQGYRLLKEVPPAQHFVSTSGHSKILYCATEVLSNNMTKQCHIDGGATYCHQSTSNGIAKFSKVQPLAPLTLMNHLASLVNQSYIISTNTCNFPALKDIPAREMNKIKQLFGYQGFCPTGRVLCEQKHVKGFDNTKFYLATVVADANSKSLGIVYNKREDTYKFPDLAGKFLGPESKKIASYIMQVCLPNETATSIVNENTSLTMVQDQRGYLHEFNFNSDRMHAINIGEFWNYTKGSVSLLMDPILNYTMPTANENCMSKTNKNHKWRLGYHSADKKVICTKNADQSAENVQSCLENLKWVDWNNKTWCLNASANGTYYVAKGMCDPCPYGGSFDGANCLLGYLPANGNIVDKKAYYYKTQPAPKYCESGDELSTSSGMCWRKSIVIHSNADSFILNGNTIYYKPLCKITN